ncbi:MAG TPA: hypothetical protein VNA69_11565 [Thermoanaerobaculia bacterium]|nr:hypothetical protein [Thermoanaerobaculia bacterium]
MNALLRYAVVKSLRDHLLAGLLLAPLVLTVSPMLGVAAIGAVRGDSFYPFHIPAATPAATGSIFATVTAIVSAFVAGVGAFWIFRSEIASRAVNFFFLARHPRAVSGASTVYGFAAGMLAYGAARVSVAALTASPQPAAKELLTVTATILIGSSLGSLLVAISAEPAILVPVYAGVMISSISLLESADLQRIAVAVAFALALIQAAPIVLRRRCAS